MSREERFALSLDRDLVPGGSKLTLASSIRFVASLSGPGGVLCSLRPGSAAACSPAVRAADDRGPGAGAGRRGRHDRRARLRADGCSTSRAGSMDGAAAYTDRDRLQGGQRKRAGDCSVPMGAGVPLIIAPYFEADGRLHASLATLQADPSSEQGQKYLAEAMSLFGPGVVPPPAPEVAPAPERGSALENRLHRSRVRGWRLARVRDPGPGRATPPPGDLKLASQVR